MPSTAGARYLAHEQHEREPQPPTPDPVEPPRPAAGPVWQRAVMDVETILILAAICGCTVKEFTGRYDSR